MLAFFLIILCIALLLVSSVLVALIDISIPTTSKHHHHCTLELSDVVALFNNDSLSDNSTRVDIPFNTSTALSQAFWNDSDIVVG